MGGALTQRKGRLKLARETFSDDLYLVDVDDLKNNKFFKLT
jgi:hypothetical protein